MSSSGPAATGGGELRGASLKGIPETGRLVVGFSGGADSTALTHWLMNRVDRERIFLAHVNHLLRGEESERDQEFAQDFAARRGLAIQVLRVDVAALARARGQGMEECGREARYGFFARLVSGENDRILTAHNAQDNGETLLLNLCRGTGPDGLSGIPRSRGKILRPLLGADRREIEEYCRRNGLPYVTDSTNLEDVYCRNRIRHQVMPVLEEINPRSVQAMAQAAELLAADREYLRAQALRLLDSTRARWGLEREPLLRAHQSLRSRALKLYLEEAGCGRLEKKHLDLAQEILSRGGGADLPGGISVSCGQGVFWVGKRPLEESWEFLAKTGETPLPGGKILVLRKKILGKTENPEKIQNLLFKNPLDYAIMTGTLVVRNRRPGDRFAPAGRGVTKPLKQVFQELRIPEPLRGTVPLLVCGGEIAWIPGAGAGEGFQAARDPGNLWSVEVKEEKGDF